MFADEIKNHLTENLIPFWKGLIDRDFGGYYGFSDFDHTVNEKYEKGCILNSRILWFFSSCAELTDDKDCIGYAGHAYDFLKSAYLDRKNGGVYWSVTYDGDPLDTTKHTYCQAFAIYALAAYYKVSADEESLGIANDLVKIIEQKCRDKYGYLEAFNVDFTPASNEKLSENGVMAERTMNTLLHVYEAYTGLYEVTKSDYIADRLREMLTIFKDKMYNPEKHRQEVFFDRNYTPLLDLISYGHDIETAWLIDRGIEVLDDDELKAAYGDITCDLADNILHNAFDGNSLAQECEAGVVNEDRVWWVQAEAVNGFINEYLKDPSKTEYKDAAVAQWEYIKKNFIYKDGGEWYNQLDKSGKPYGNMPVVGPWKCPYHNGRMCLEIIRRGIEF